MTQTPNRRLPAEFYQLTDPEAGVQLPPHHRVDLRLLDNRELDKLVSQLGRNKATWRRALLLHEWLVEAGHIPDDRLCTTVGFVPVARAPIVARKNARHLRLGSRHCADMSSALFHRDGYLGKLSAEPCFQVPISFHFLGCVNCLLLEHPSPHVLPAEEVACCGGNSFCCSGITGSPA